MSLTIDLAPETEERLNEEASKHGLPASEYARRLIEERLTPPSGPPLVRRERERRVKSAFGKYAYLKTSADEFCQRKQEEIDLEDRPR